jgi:hypothetical protein
MNTIDRSVAVGPVCMVAALAFCAVSQQAAAQAPAPEGPSSEMSACELDPESGPQISPLSLPFFLSNPALLQQQIQSFQTSFTDYDLCAGARQTLQDTSPTATKRITRTVANRMRQGRRQAMGGGGTGPTGLGPTDTISLQQSGSGYAAGEHSPRIGIWTNGGHTWTENENVDVDFDGTITTGMVGADYWVTDRFLLGGFGGIEETDVTTNFNQGELEGLGYTVGGYASYVLGRGFAIEVQAGATFTDLDTKRTSLVTGLDVSGDTDSDRLFGSIGFSGDLDYSFDSGTLYLSPTVRYLLAQEETDTFTDSEGIRIGRENVDLGLLQIGGRAGYQIGRFEPFIGGFFELVTFSTDVKVADAPDPQQDMANGDFFAGIDFYASDLITGGVEVDHKFEMQDAGETSISANLSFTF